MRTSELIAFAVGLTAGILIGAGAIGFALIAASTMVTTRLQATAPTPTPPPPDPIFVMPEPFPGYTNMPIQTIRESLRALSLEQREAVRVYETATLKRRGILSVLTALEEEAANGV